MCGPSPWRLGGSSWPCWGVQDRGSYRYPWIYAPDSTRFRNFLNQLSSESRGQGSRAVPYPIISTQTCIILRFTKAWSHTLLTFLYPYLQFSSVVQSCPTLWDPKNRSTPGLPVHHQLPEFTQTHVHRVSDAIQPSHTLSSPSPPAPNPSQHQSLFQWVNCSHEVAKVLEFQL